jgi:hypothetical protein
MPEASANPRFSEPAKLRQPWWLNDVQMAALGQRPTLYRGTAAVRSGPFLLQRGALSWADRTSRLRFDYVRRGHTWRPDRSPWRPPLGRHSGGRLSPADPCASGLDASNSVQVRLLWVGDMGSIGSGYARLGRYDGNGIAVAGVVEVVVDFPQARRLKSFA